MKIKCCNRHRHMRKCNSGNIDIPVIEATTLSSYLLAFSPLILWVKQTAHKPKSTTKKKKSGDSIPSRVTEEYVQGENVISNTTYYYMWIEPKTPHDRIENHHVPCRNGVVLTGKQDNKLYFYFFSYDVFLSAHKTY